MHPSAPRWIAIGDVHGCVHALDALLEAIAPTANDHLVFLGDLIDQGTDSRDVLERIAELRQHCPVTLIQGNHEEMMLAAREEEPALRYWEMCGGVATLNSYRYGGKLSDIPASHWALVESCLPYLETDDVIFTHAHYQADLSMNEQPGYELRWALFEPAKLQPHISGKRVIVGHTEQPDSEVCDLGFATCIDTACYKYGWLTALEVGSNHVWQASRWGKLRDPGEATHRAPLAKLLRKDAAPVDNLGATAGLPG